MRHIRDPRGHSGMRKAFLAISLVSAISLSACATGGEQQGSVETTVVIGQTAPIDTLNPASFQQANMTWDRALFDALTVIDDDGNPQPHLASSWDVSDDGTTFTFHLVEGVEFHDGKPLTAAVVVETFTWWVDPVNRATAAPLLSEAEVRDIDDLTVEVVFPRATPQFPAVLAVIPIVDVTSDIAAAPNGTGPYTVESFAPNAVLTLALAPDYWNSERQQKVDTLEVRVFSDNAAAAAALATGQIDVFAFPPFSQVEQLESQGNTVVTRPAPGNFMLRLNTSASPLDDVRVRQALSLAVDRAAFASLAGYDGIVPTCNVFPIGSPAYLPEADENCDQDLDAAKRLLEEAGYDSGLQIEMLINTARWPEQARYAPILKQDLATIGVELTLSETALQPLITKLVGGEWQMATDWYPWGNLDPALMFLTTFAPTNNPILKMPPEFADMVNAAQTETDAEIRLTSYQEVSEYMIDQHFVVPLATRPYLYVTSEDVTAFRFDPFGMVDPSQLAG